MIYVRLQINFPYNNLIAEIHEEITAVLMPKRDTPCDALEHEKPD